VPAGRPWGRPGGGAGPPRGTGADRRGGGPAQGAGGEAVVEPLPVPTVEGSRVQAEALGGLAAGLAVAACPAGEAQGFLADVMLPIAPRLLAGVVEGFGCGRRASRSFLASASRAAWRPDRRSRGDGVGRGGSDGRAAAKGGGVVDGSWGSAGGGGSMGKARASATCALGGTSAASRRKACAWRERTVAADRAMGSGSRRQWLWRRRNLRRSRRAWRFFLLSASAGAGGSAGVGCTRGAASRPVPRGPGRLAEPPSDPGVPAGVGPRGGLPGPRRPAARLALGAVDHHLE